MTRAGRAAGPVLGLAGLVSLVLLAPTLLALRTSGPVGPAGLVGSVGPGPATRAAPDAATPAAGICDRVTGALVTIELGSDGPGPRCVRVEGWQRLRLVNHAAALTATLGARAIDLGPNEALVLDRPVGEYLQPGVHRLRASIYGGSGPELWLVES